MPTTLYAAVLIEDRYIYTFGGLGGETSGFNHSNHVYRQNIVDNLSSWPGTYAPLPDLPGARMDHAAVFMSDNRIFVIGGQQKEGCFADAVFLDSVVATSEPVTD